MYLYQPTKKKKPNLEILFYTILNDQLKEFSGTEITLKYCQMQSIYTNAKNTIKRMHRTIIKPDNDFIFILRGKGKIFQPLKLSIFKE